MILEGGILSSLCGGHAFNPFISNADKQSGSISTKILGSFA